MLPLLLWCLVCLYVDDVHGKFAARRILPSASSAQVNVRLNISRGWRDLDGHPATMLAVRGGAELPPPPLSTTTSQAQEAVKRSYSVQVALCLTRLGCILGSFLYQGCLTVADWSPFLAAHIESKALIRIAQAVNFLFSGGLFHGLLLESCETKVGSSIHFARQSTGSIFLASKRPPYR
jgi:hypothetical protein